MEGKAVSTEWWNQRAGRAHLQSQGETRVSCGDRGRAARGEAASTRKTETLVQRQLKKKLQVSSNSSTVFKVVPGNTQYLTGLLCFPLSILSGKQGRAKAFCRGTEMEEVI